MKENIKTDINEIAKYFLILNPNFTDKQIQKLVYYAYSWYIVLNNKDSEKIENRLVKEHPEAWIHGPVFPELFANMKKNRKAYTDVDKVVLPTSVARLLDLIYKNYGYFSGNKLEDMTHNETPWMVARGDRKENERCQEKLDDKIIFQEYCLN